jgi:hypothetical protein
LFVVRITGNRKGANPSHPTCGTAKRLEESAPSRARWARAQYRFLPDSKNSRFSGGLEPNCAIRRRMSHTVAKSIREFVKARIPFNIGSYRLQEKVFVFCFLSQNTPLLKSMVCLCSLAETAFFCKDVRLKKNAFDTYRRLDKSPGFLVECHYDWSHGVME